jgi:hypothetical protein
MDISPKPPTAKGPAETFTGDVWVDPVTRGLPPSPLNMALVRFTPGARSAWHSHAAVKPCMSPKAVAWSRPEATKPQRSTPVTSCSPPTEKSTGTAPPPTTS